MFDISAVLSPYEMEFFLVLLGYSYQHKSTQGGVDMSFILSQCLEPFLIPVLFSERKPLQTVCFSM